MKLKIAATGTLVFLLTGCVTTSENSTIANTSISINTPSTIAKTASTTDTMSLENLSLMANRTRINRALQKLRSHVGKTWYVFSGATPSGWDCSGLTMWFYEQLGVQIEHRASKQDRSGVQTDTPNPGDIVVFHYKGSSDAYHVGIYIGNGKMIHAPKHGHVTRVEDISTFGGNYSNISYRRLIDSV